MHNQIPSDWEPGHNIKWQPGSDRKVREMARGFWGVLAIGGIFFLASLLTGCCTFCNTGSLSGAKAQWRDHIASPGKMVQAQMEVTP